MTGSPADIGGCRCLPISEEVPWSIGSSPGTRGILCSVSDRNGTRRPPGLSPMLPPCRRYSSLRMRNEWEKHVRRSARRGCSLRWPSSVRSQDVPSSDTRTLCSSSIISVRRDLWPKSSTKWTDGRIRKAKEALAAARAYNKQLAEGGQGTLASALILLPRMPAKSTTNDVGDSASARDATYMGLLNASNDGIMGSIVIPQISVDLPIYHGTSASALARGQAASTARRCP